jgi:SAM-dependent methyltransferase
MTTQGKIAERLQPYTVKGSVPEFIESVSNVYHRFESDVYDASQVSLRDSEKSWQKALHAIQPELPGKLRLLDYGAGTGFATLQVLNSSLGPFISEVVCFDLSPAMIKICSEKMNSYPDVTFTFLADVSGRQELENQQPFNLVVTNAFLHHLLDVEGFLKQVRQYVAASGFYMAGHEPNYNFYVNEELVQVTRAFQRYKRIRQRLTLRYWLLKAGIKKSNPDLATLVNQELLRSGLSEQSIPANLLHKLVDIHVPFGISTDQPWGEIGFKDSTVAQWLGSDFEWKGTYTYSHIKDGLANRDWYWKKRLPHLEATYPLDGADALMVFRKKD